MDLPCGGGISRAFVHKERLVLYRRRHESDVSSCLRSGRPRRASQQALPASHK